MQPKDLAFWIDEIFPIFCPIKEKHKLRGENVPSVHTGVTYPPKLSPQALNTNGQTKQANWLNRLLDWVDSLYK